MILTHIFRWAKKKPTNLSNRANKWTFLWDFGLKVIEIDGHLELEMYPLALHISRTDQAGGEGY